MFTVDADDTYNCSDCRFFDRRQFCIDEQQHCSDSPATTASTATAGNLQTFTGALGNVAAPAVTSVGNGQFQVAGNSIFNSQQSAIVRSWYVASSCLLPSA